MDISENGFRDFNNELEQFIKLAENILDEEEKMAKEFVDDLLKLPQPKSNISKPGYTHLIDSFAYKRKENEIEVGWGKYYGPMVERGTVKMRAHSHLAPLWNKNSSKYVENFKKRTNL